MERKDYEEKFFAIKMDIFNEIRNNVPEESAHYFKNEFPVHYIDGEVATTELCVAVEVWRGGEVVFIVKQNEQAEVETVDDGKLFRYDTASYLDILDHLQKEVREEKLSRLRELVRNNGGVVRLDGTFGFNALVADNHVAGEKSMITCIELDPDKEDRVYFDCHISGERIEEEEENIPLDQLDSIIAYVESKTKKKYTVEVSGSFSRVWEIEAATYQDAIKEAKEDWEANPLEEGDVNGFDWRSWQE